MNKLKLKLISSALVALLILPAPAQAYFTTGQTATRITSDTILYTVSYKFGLRNRDLFMPIGALNNTKGEGKSPYLEYSLIADTENKTSIGTSAGLVFTSDEDVEIKDNQYFVPAGESAEFTLVTLVTIPKDERATNQDLSLQVTRLPFIMIDNGVAYPNKLNPSELQYYETPTIKFRSIILGQ